MGYLQYQYQDSDEQNDSQHDFQNDYWLESCQHFNLQQKQEVNTQFENINKEPENLTRENINVDHYFVDCQQDKDECISTESKHLKQDYISNQALYIWQSGEKSCLSNYGEPESKKSHAQQIAKEPKKYPKRPSAVGKNIAKNLCRALKSFIFANFELDDRQMEPFKRFLALKLENCGKQRLQQFLRTTKGNAIGRMFFQNYQWARQFLDTNKVDLHNQIKYNNYWVCFLKNN